MKRVSFRQQLVFFLALDLLFVLVAVVLIVTLTHVFAHSSPDTMELSFVEGSGDVVLLELSKQYSWVSLSKVRGLWLGEHSGSPKGTLWPCDEKKVATLLDELSATFSAHKIADGSSSWRGFELSERTCVKIKVRQEGREAVSWRFSPQSTQHTLIFRTPAAQTVWETGSAAGEFLVAEADFWADPYAIPSFASVGENAAAIKRGELFCLMPASHLVPTAVHEVHFAGGISATFAVYNKDDEYVVRASFSCPTFPELDLVSYGYMMDERGLDALLEEIAR